MTTTVIGMFKSTQHANMAVRDLETAGIAKDQVDVIAKAGAAATGGGVVDTLRSSGVPDDMAQAFEEGIRRGSTLVHVRTDDGSAERVAGILDRHGAMHIDDLMAQRTAGPAAGARPAAAPPRTAGPAHPGVMAGRAETGRAETGPIREQVVQEELVVGKQPVVRGGVRIFPHTTERPVTERVTLRDETIRVDRRPADRPATEADLNRPAGRDVVIREVDEEPVVGKRARVVEEVVVSKDAREREETVRDTVRRRDVDVRPVEGAGAGPDAFARYETDFRTHYDRSLGRSGMSYEQYAPAYRYGGQLAGDQRYSGRDWTAVRSDARADWERRNPGSGWDRVEQAVQYGWEKVRGRG